MQVQPRVTQLARILDEEPQSLDDDASASHAIENHADALANAFFHEAADSDDVLSTETALEYLEGRLQFFGGLVSETAAARIRKRFNELVSQWER